MKAEHGSLLSLLLIAPCTGAAQAPFEWTFDERWSARSSSAFADAQDRLSPRDERDSRIDPSGTPGSLRVDAGFMWQPGDAWRLGAGVDNVLDRRYRAHGSGIDAPGRSVYVTAALTW